MTDPYTPELRRTNTGDAFQARATHPCGRSLLRVSALCVGIAIASCSPPSQVQGFECTETHPGWRNPEKFEYIGRAHIMGHDCLSVADTEGWRRRICDDGPDEFTCRPATVFAPASAGEAGTAETVKQGSVHEHATRQGDAQ